MKKFLSLVLALTMAMSLVVVNTSAKEFTDNDELNYKEAVDVISEIGVVDGYTDGSFNPQGGLTRGAAAKIICNLILGPTTAAELHADTRPFSDVAINSEFAGYIAYCAQQGIISGYADGEFKAANPLTGYAFMKMLLGALGYDQNTEGYVGENWSINVAKQALGVGLNVGLVDEFNGVDYVTREEAALYAFNTLKATLVDYDTSITANVNGAEVVISNGTAYPVGWDNQNIQTGIVNDGNIKDDNFVQFAEEYFPDLVGRFDTDDFERPATLWTYEKQEIGTYVRWEKLVESYTAGVTGRDVFDLLTGGVIDDNDVLRFVDGGQVSTFNADTELVRSNRDDLDYTGNGVLTEVYLDNDRDEIRIVSVNTWLAQATTDYNSNTEIGTLKIFESVNTSNMTTNATTQTVDVTDVPEVESLTKDQFVLVNQSIKDRTRLQVVAISEPEILEDCTVTAFSKDNKDNLTDGYGPEARGLYNSVTTNGEKYDGAAMGWYDASVLNEYDADLLKDNSYNLYLDPYGYVIGVDLYEGTQNYVFITGYNRTADSNISIDTAQAAAIFLDGTMRTITVNVRDTNKNIEAVNTSLDYVHYFDETEADQGNNLWVAGGEPNENKWYTYTVTDDNVYTLKPVKQQSTTEAADVPGATQIPGTTDYTGTIDCSRVYLPDSSRGSSAGYSYGEDASVYIVVSQGDVDTTNSKAITEVNGVYTGVQDVKIEIDSREIASDSVTSLSADTYKVNPVYTVYDGDYYVIASIVIGEAQGATKNYAYILSGATAESVSNGVTYWTFDAILNGEKQELTIEDKFGNTIQNLKPNTVQELIFTGDYVTKIEDIDAADQVNCAFQRIDTNNHSVYDITFNTSTNGESTVAADVTGSTYQQPVNGGTANADNTTIYLQGRTLWTTKMTGATASHSTPGDSHTDESQPVGLTFVNDAPAVVIQMENSKKTTVGYASVAEALGSMADANTGVSGQQFRGRIVAVLNDLGVAEWVVFISSTPVTAGQVGPTTPTGMITVLPQTTMANNVIDVHLADEAAGASHQNAVIAAAYNALLANGYTGYPMGLTANVRSASGTPTTAGSFIATNASGQMAMITVRYQDYNTLNVNGTTVEYVRNGGTVYTTAAMIQSYGNNEGTGYTTDNGATWTSYATAPSGAASGAVSILTGYVQVPASASIDRSTTVGTNGVTAFTSATGSNGTNTAVKAGSSITIDVVTTANGSASTGSMISVVLDGSAVATVSAPQPMTTQEATDGKALQFTISNIQSDITSIAVKAVDYAAFDVTVNHTDTNLCGLTVDNISVDRSTISTTDANKTAVVTITLSGTVAGTSGVKLTANAATGATAYTWNPVDYTVLGGSVSGSGNVDLKIPNGAILSGTTIRCTVTLDASDDAPIVITLDDAT